MPEGWKVESAGVHALKYNSTDEHHTYAEITVPGIGKIRLDDCLSKETVTQLHAEVTVALKKKMGQAA